MLSKLANGVIIYLNALRMVALGASLPLRLTLGWRIPSKAWRRWYNLLSALMLRVSGERRISGELWFMNYGYVAPDTPSNHMLGHDAVQIGLVRHVATCAGTSEPAGERVLEVGCGRGGGAAWMTQFLRPANVTGIDLSEENIAAGRRQFSGLPGLIFAVGDAERLPFVDGEFDRVVNVESSHCYPHFPTFLAECHRVLRPGGVLCLADWCFADRVADWERQLAGGALEVIDREEITEGVVRALEVDHDRKVAAIAASGAPRFMHALLRQFAGCLGTDMHRTLLEGRRRYWRFVLRRPD